MPLITITGSGHWHPQPGQPNAYATAARMLGEALPELIVGHADELGLEPDMPTAAVQVDFQGFSPYAINAPDIWVLVVFTETPGEEQRRAICDCLVKLVTAQLDQAPQVPASVAIDVFFGPGHGFFRSPTTTFSW